jgi:hypothetical protein
MSEIRIVKTKMSRHQLLEVATERYSDLVKAVVDVEQGIAAIGGELHADEEAALLEEGSRQANLWGINLYPQQPADRWIEFDSVINIRPSCGNRTRGIDNGVLREKIVRVVNSLFD